MMSWPIQMSSPKNRRLTNEQKTKSLKRSRVLQKADIGSLKMAGTFSLKTRVMKMKINLLISTFVVFGFEWTQAGSCESNVFSKSHSHLECLAKSDLSRALTQGLRAYSELKNECDDCKAPFLGAEEFSHLFGAKYLVVAHSKNEFGGMNLFAIIKNSSSLFKFWIYEIENGQGEIRQISATKPSKEMASTIQDLQQQSLLWK